MNPTGYSWPAAWTIYITGGFKWNFILLPGFKTMSRSAVLPNCLKIRLDTYLWLDVSPLWPDIHVSEKTTDNETLRHIGEQEYNGVKQADVVIILTPQEEELIKFGMAIALGKIIYLCHEDDTYFKCDDNTSAFYWLPEVKHLIGNTDYIAIAA